MHESTETCYVNGTEGKGSIFGSRKNWACSKGGRGIREREGAISFSLTTTRTGKGQEKKGKKKEKKGKKKEKKKKKKTPPFLSSVLPNPPPVSIPCEVPAF